jgi:hypothetical protein
MSKVIKNIKLFEGVKVTAIEDLDLLTANNTVEMTNKSFGDALTLKEIDTPSTPASSYIKFYPKTNGKLYYLDDNGVESEVGGGGGGISYSAVSSDFTIDFNNGYLIDSDQTSASIKIYLPSSFAQGDQVALIGNVPAGYEIYSGSSVQTIVLDETESNVGTGEMIFKTLKKNACIHLVAINSTKLVGKSYVGTFSGPTNYFGDESDGALNLTSSLTLTASEDGDVVVKNYTNITIGAGHMLTTDNRCKGLVLYATGNVDVSGIISMSARGASADPVTAGVSSTGLRIIRRKTGETDTLSGSDVAGCGNAFINAEAKQPALDNNGKIFTIARTGASGGAGVSASGDSAATGNTGSAGSAGTTGGGGSGAASHQNAGTSTSGAGGAGTCFSGGAGSGAINRNADSASTSAGSSTGGAGSNASSNSSPAGGGAGNPAGSAAGGGSNGVAGTGGLLIIIAKGNVTINSGGIVRSNGSNGGGASGGGRPVGGGGSGGGSILILHGGSYTNNGTVQATGGTRGIASGGAGSSSDGGNGGAGSIVTSQVDQE